MTDLQNIKPGDDVAYVAGGCGSGVYIRKVERVTKTQIIIGDSRYRREDGFPVGHTIWDAAHICELTPEMEKRVKETADREKKTRLVAEIHKALRGLTLDQLERINAIVDEGGEK
jgi:predicted nucleotidyltransferase